MFNLLPIELKKIIKKEYKMRWLTLVLFFAVGIEASFLIFLFPTWLVSSHKESEISKQSEQAKELLAKSDIVPATAVIKSLNSRLNIVDNSLDYPKLLPIIDEILSKKTSSIRLTEFTYTSNASSTAELILGGIGGTRESLVQFVNKLKEIKSFKKVDLPISNLAKDKNINFKITITISI